MAELRLGFADKNKTIPAKVGETLVITLPENATTGYQWKVASLTENTLALESTTATSAPSEYPGAGGSEVFFRLKTTAPGPGKINLKLLRGTERDGDSAFGFELNFDIS